MWGRVVHTVTAKTVPSFPPRHLPRKRAHFCSDHHPTDQRAAGRAVVLVAQTNKLLFTHKKKDLRVAT